MRAKRARRIVALGCALLLLLSSAGCGGEDTSGTPAAAEVETIRVSGSGTCRPLVQILSEAYEDGDIEFSFLPGLHSGGGIKGVSNEDLDLGTVSRELTDDEKALGLLYTSLSSDGLVIAAHRDIDVEGLTTQQVKDIYSGKITNWSTVGGPDLSITVLDRNEDESA